MKKFTIGQGVLRIIIIMLMVICFIPMLLIVIASFTDASSLSVNGFKFYPDKWSLDGWKYALSFGDRLVRCYLNTILITIVGTLGSLLVSSMMAYTMSRQTFLLRNFYSIILLVTMLFSGGQLSSYLINTQYYHLNDNMLILMLPSVGAMNIIMMRTYIRGNITDALIESAKIDGAGEVRIYAQIVMPLMPPVLASLGFMTAVGYWNNWATAQLYIKTPSKWPLQLFLQNIESNIEEISSGKIPTEAVAAMMETIPEEPARMAILLIVLGPIMIAYPFFQKYFIKGLTVGAVKG